MQQNFATFGLLCFARQWSNTFKVWRDIWYRFCCKFNGNTTVKKFWKSVNIGQTYDWMYIVAQILLRHGVFPLPLNSVCPTRRINFINFIYPEQTAPRFPLLRPPVFAVDQRHCSLPNVFGKLWYPEFMLLNLEYQRDLQMKCRASDCWCSHFVPCNFRHLHDTLECTTDLHICSRCRTSCSRRIKLRRHW